MPLPLAARNLVRLWTSVELLMPRRFHDLAVIKAGTTTMIPTNVTLMELLPLAEDVAEVTVAVGGFLCDGMAL